MNQTEPANLTDEIHFTPQELGKIIKLHPDTVIKIFRDEPGVVRVGHGPGRLRRDKETGMMKPVRQYFSLRIPRYVARRVFERLSVKPPNRGRAA
jgi:hypothetical protein